ncbi:suppressor APC domain-containing protein 2-like [Rhincodon typus]|uniref:suppressor APC domain-containing protein 2-like n=1 Tax=Rhincodon typus TaxID=259920 RepID=UPI002030B0FD|nr:suppressor APC domain-containing protein 2-like [Rhincodon typus]
MVKATLSEVFNQSERLSQIPDRKGLGAGTTSVGLGSSRRSSQEDQDLRYCTIADGGNNNTLKELECQRDALLHGLEVVEWARDWYRQQILALHQRQKHVRRVIGNKGIPTQPETHLVNIYGSSSLPEDQLAQPPQDRACRLLAKIQEVNCCLGDLICSSGKELSSKRERIAILEQEKASLVKRLIEARGQGQPASPPHRPYPHWGSEGTP